jgi:hypothetical protein
MTRKAAVLPLPEKRGLNRAEAAEYVGVSLWKFARLISRGRLPGHSFDLGEGPVWDRLKLERAIGYVFVFLYRDHIKIGWSRNVTKRFWDIQRGLPTRDMVVMAACCASQQLERAFHKRFAEHRENGEWFRLGGELEKWVEEGFPL